MDIHLNGRPLNQAVQYILGSAGLTATVSLQSIDVRGELPPFPDGEAARNAAEVRYLAALRRFPTGPGAVRARQDLAELALDGGQLQKAVRHYELLIEDFPDDDSAQESHMAVGRLLVELELWTQALPHFAVVANVELDESTAQRFVPILAEARRELARCILMRGEPRRARFMLQGLEQVIPPVDDNDRAQRWLLMARALLDLGQHERGLRFLDRALNLGQGIISEFEGMDLRARGLVLAGEPIEGSLAWLHFSRTQPITTKRKALARAAQLALSVEGEELAVLFLQKHADKEGLGDVIEPYSAEARSRLGLDAKSFENSTPSIRLDRGEQLLASGSSDQALRVFRALQQEIWTLSTAERMRYGMAYAPLLEQQESADASIEFLRNLALSLESVENRSRVYLLAAEILERHARFEEAAEAYGGKL